MSDSRPPELGAEFRDDYELIRELGQGAMGAVWLARQAKLKRQVAIKFVRGAGETVSRLHREAKILSELSHPNLVAIFDSGLANETAFIVLEFVEGESLDARLDREKKLPEGKATAIVEQMVKALAYIHERGILHRDLKPGNILIAKDGTAKLSDFGLARWSEKEATFQTREGLVPGSPAFMSPELLTTGKATAQTDLWALSVTLFRMVSGDSPFFAGDIQSLMGQIFNKDPFENPQFSEAFSPGMRDFLAVALAKEPGERYADTTAYLAALKRSRVRTGSSGRVPVGRLASSSRLTPATEQLSMPPQPTVRGKRVAGALAAGLLAMLGGGLALGLRPSGGPAATGPQPLKPEVVAAARLPPPAKVKGVDLIVRAFSAAIRFTSEAPGRFQVVYGPSPATLAAASAEATASTTHLLRLAPLLQNKRYFYEVRPHGDSGFVVAKGELATLSEIPYWERREYRSRAGPLTPLGKNAQGAEEFLDELDGTVMILVPGAEYAMGDPTGEAKEHCRPVHTVRVSTFLLDRLPVTRRQYETFMKATGYETASVVGLPWKEWDDRPMNFLTWTNANEYCRWAGKRLPTEAEWELAAGGGTGRRYSWGDERPERETNLDWGMFDKKEERDLLPAGSFPRSAGPFGHLDLGGGVRNWCADWHDRNYYSHSPKRDPQGPTVSLEWKRSERGAGFESSNETLFEIWRRNDHSMIESTRITGFRGARDL